MALKGVCVIELAGLAPAPFCGMILSDFGAKVTRIDKTRGLIDKDRLGRGKTSIAVDLKKAEGVNIVRRLCSNADVIIEPFRKGVMEKLGLGPESLMSDNPRLIYARLTGFGQQGPWSHKAGHDINYIALSGILSQLGRRGDKPYAPINLMADFAGGGLICAFGIAMALLERSTSGKGQIIDANMVEGSAYIGSWLWKSRDMPIWGNARGCNVLDGGAAFYETYETKDGKYVAVGAIEPQFFRDLLKGLELSPEDVQQTDNPIKMAETFRQVFLTKTRDEWVKRFKDLDACVAPVLEQDEAPKHPHNIHNKSFLTNPEMGSEPAPAPRLSRTPGTTCVLPHPKIGQHTIDILQEAGFTKSQVQSLLDMGVVEQNGNSKL